MTNADRVLAARLTSGVAVAVVTLATQKVLDGTWKAATGNPPPSDPSDPDVEWKTAIGWAVVSGVVLGLAQLVASRGVGRYVRYRRR
jgi:hypothetical protein